MNNLINKNNISNNSNNSIKKQQCITEPDEYFLIVITQLKNNNV